MKPAAAAPRNEKEAEMALSKLKVVGDGTLILTFSNIGEVITSIDFDQATINMVLPSGQVGEVAALLEGAAQKLRANIS